MTLNERIALMHSAIDTAEELDSVERFLDPYGPPPRHAAMAYQRLRQLQKEKARQPKK
ncbi:MAG: hypothetical protein ABR601_02650 [Parasphingopyxis sp.]|nr:hypothetical protein [Sphingomonadales bacterium]